MVPQLPASVDFWVTLRQEAIWAAYRDGSTCIADAGW